MTDIDYKVGDWVVLIPEMWEGIQPEAYNVKFDTPYHVKFISQPFGGGYKSIELFGVNGRYDSWYFKKANSVVPTDEKFPSTEDVVKDVSGKWTDKHYDTHYTLTAADIEDGKIKMDAYFVAKVWRTGSRDDSGALWHCLKSIARFGDKNDVEREIKALYNQAKALGRIYNVDLD